MSIYQHDMKARHSVIEAIEYDNAFSHLLRPHRNLSLSSEIINNVRKNQENYGNMKVVFNWSELVVVAELNTNCGYLSMPLLTGQRLVV
jgi:hypothetical protein